MKYRRLRSFARIFLRTSEGSMKSSKVDLPHSVAMVLKALAMVVNVVMEIVHQIVPTRMVVLVVAMEDTTHQLPIPQAMS
jgi:hypothetical protein